MKTAEIAFNFWYYVDEESGYVYSLAGRAYYLAGSDNKKMRILKDLSKTDYLLAQRRSIPVQFWMTVNGDKKVEYTHANFVPLLGFQLFEELAEILVLELPGIPQKIDGEWFEEPHPFPEGALCLYTALKEKEIGEITPMVR